MQTLRQGRDRAMQNLRQGLDRGMQNIRQVLDRGMENLRQGHLRQGRDRGMQNLRDRGQTIIRSMYSTIVHPIEHMPWTDILVIGLMVLISVLSICLNVMPQLRADYFFSGIKRK